MDREPPLHLDLVDGFRLHGDGESYDLPLNARRVLAFLALNGNPSRGCVAGHLWPEVSDKHALGSLRTVLHRLQSACPDVVRVCRDTLALDPSVRVDFHRITSWALAVLPGTGGRGPTEPPARVLDGFYRGELLPGWYDEWVLLEREQFHQLRMHALEAWSDRLAASGRFGEALYAAHGAVRVSPLRESAHRAVIRIHLAEGNVTEALRQYESFRALLHTELGADPSRLMDELLDGRAVLSGSGARPEPGRSLTHR
ncbi:BTAD domain-containing putative transcriptional regulator [Streptomyces sp. NPDC001941]|uniref:AfsR/SARP family transcriptional regulator n=1 Tax=Streptomyces sp. NPDC001941 TaxID=3154659 RepID=UPI00332D1708